jgi:2-oxo-4-hydroxy-4-carboxy-5-ureidoimidazoline decarboxylase
MDQALARFNNLPPEQASEALAACCAAQVWVDGMLRARPDPDREALAAQSKQALAGLEWVDIEQALAAHPRIGERMAEASAREAAWSASEQSGMDSSSAQTRAALVEANRAYEERFGHVFLIFATGKTDEQLLAAARARVHNDVAVEGELVRAELSMIVALRLTKMLDSLDAA